MIWPTRRSSGNPVTISMPPISRGDGAATPERKDAQPSPTVLRSIAVAEAEARKADLYTDLKVQMHQKLIERINLSALETMTRDQVGRDIGDIVQEMLKEINHALNLAERRQLVEDILDELLGLGPLEPLLKDPTISDIMVNSATKVFVERRGRIEQVATRFADDKHLLRIIGGRPPGR
jgi:pilus assembly protein CpaF